ncbi:MAG: lysophospholipid acyltransferase family protein [Jhaorihella sp.]
MPADPADLSAAARVKYFAANLVLRAVIGAIGLLPYRRRIPTMGRLASRLAPLAGFDRRVRHNLSLARPDLSEAEVRRLCRAVPDNAGRYLIEMFSGEEFVARAATSPIEGPGLAALEQARASGRPVILVTGHFGNYDAARAALVGRGFDLGALYRRMANPYFNTFYVRAMQDIGGILFEQGRRGMAEMVRHLRGGGIIAIVADLHAHGGRELTFFGQPAVTSIVTAELAVKYDAVLIPLYAVRQPGGLDFRIELHAPIAHRDPETMMQQVNDDLEAMVRAHMGQWFWIHRRWKPWLDLGLQPEP